MPFIIRVLLVFLAIILIQVYFVKKLNRSVSVLFPNTSRKKIKAIKITGLIYLNLYPVAAILIWAYVLINKVSNFVPPQGVIIDYLLIYPFWIGLIIIIQSVLIYLLLDILKLILFPLYKKYKILLKRKEALLFLIIVLFFSVYVPVRIIYDLNSVSTRIVLYDKKEVPAVLENFKIVLFSDVQADRYTNNSRLEKFVEKVNETKPDLVLIAGDIITSTPLYINLGAEYLGKIKSKYGVYSCVGDHDNWAYRFDYERSLREITEALQKVNIPMLDNEKITISVDSADIGISFITNTYVEKIGESTLDDIINGGRSYDLKIFLTHQPRQHLIEKAIEFNYDLMFTGHTHGGQITLFFPFVNLTPTQVETNYIKGDFWFGDMMLTVTRGLGMSIAPIRYNSTPEITVIIIKNPTK